ncbi:MAG TPA: hypothetical protein PKC70_00100 [Cellvibrionaceae bacterium]|nr:hypothetical protein [Cellvibrionaceae bacterium]
MNSLLFISVLTLFWAMGAQAQLPRWNFWQQQHPFSIEVAGELSGHPDLAKQLTQQLTQERKNNPDILALDDATSIAQQELGVLESLLRTQGYYNGRASLKNLKPLRYQVEPGSHFFIEQLILALPESDPPLPSLALSWGTL